MYYLFAMDTAPQMRLQRHRRLKSGTDKKEVSKSENSLTIIKLGFNEHALYWFAVEL